MTPERWQKVCAVLNELLPLEPQRRQQELGRLRHDDAELAAEVESLLRQRTAPGRLELDKLPTELKDAIGNIVPATVQPVGRADNWIGQQLMERYEIVRELGRGGMAVAYLATDQRLRGDVVVKVPQTALLADNEFARRFAREVRAMVCLSHAHIVRIIDAGEHQGLPFAVLQYLSGGSLRSRYLGSGKRCGAAELRTWLPQVASALDYIHQQHFVHRDVEPDNILFDGAGNAYLSDFGIAKVLANSPRTKMTVVTAAGNAIGTPRYMAPEMLLGTPFGGRADQFALAATVYEVLSGRMPFDGKTLMTVYEQQKKPPLPLDRVAPEVLSEVACAVQQALDRVPAQRFASCTAFAGAVLNAEMGIVVAEQGLAPRNTAILAAPTILPAVAAQPLPARPVAMAQPAEAAKAVGLVSLLVLGMFMALAITGLAVFLGLKAFEKRSTSENVGQFQTSAKEIKPPPIGKSDNEDSLLRGMKFVRVPKGTFWMGGGSEKPPQQQVTITNDFELAAYTVTQEQWEAVMGNNPSQFSRKGKRQDDVKDIADAVLKQFPVENVSWYDVQDFLKKLNEQENGRAWIYRLPTQSEWEYACRGGATSKEEC